MECLPGTSLCVREPISVRVHAARFLPPAKTHIPQNLRKIDSIRPSTDMVHTDLMLQKN